MTARRLLVAAALIVLFGCAAPSGDEEDDGWRPFQAGSPTFSAGGTLHRQRLPSGYGSSLTVPRVTGTARAPARLLEEDGNVWPEPEQPRTTLTDPGAVARGVPNFQPQGRPPQAAPPEGSVWDDPARDVARPARPPRNEITPQAGPAGGVLLRPDGRPAVPGAGTAGAGTFTVPGRSGVGTSLPDGSGGRILVEAGGGTVVVPR